MNKKELLEALRAELDNIQTSNFQSWEDLEGLLDKATIAKDEGYHEGFIAAIKFVESRLDND